MNPPNYITLFLSSIAISVSIISLVITLVQKRNETRRAIRKTLSDALEAIAKINIDALKVDADKSIAEDSKISFRRSFNNHRRILVVHADFLLMKYPKMVTSSRAGNGISVKYCKSF